MLGYVFVDSSRVMLVSKYAWCGAVWCGMVLARCPTTTLAWREKHDKACMRAESTVVFFLTTLQSRHMTWPKVHHTRQAIYVRNQRPNTHSRAESRLHKQLIGHNGFFLIVVPGATVREGRVVRQRTSKERGYNHPRTHPTIAGVCV